MEQLTFSPSTVQFFLWIPDEPLPGLRSELARRLDEAGWPSPAQVVRADGSHEPYAGTLIELIDALPLLCGLPAGALTPPTLTVWARAARLALDLVVRGQIAPQLRQRLGPAHDERPVGWQARWGVVLRTARERSEVLELSRSLGAAEIAVPQGRSGRGAEPAPVPGAGPRRMPSALGVMRRFLDACADVLVREASRRGAMVRLGGTPAEAWEQRLVKALSDERGCFAPPDDRDPVLLAEELSGWVEDQTESPTLLPSPPSWSAGESLERVLLRLSRPAALLGERLLLGEPAPRTLQPALPTATNSKLQQSIAVTRAVLQLTGAAASGRLADKAEKTRSRKAG